MTNRIIYSYDEGSHWYKKNISADNFIDIIPLETPKNRAIAAINYDVHNDICTFFLFDFSRVISNLDIMSERTCRVDDFEAWYVPRFNGNCFQGHEVSYLKKKPFAMCVDAEKLIIPTMKSCPCSFEDFEWYHKINQSERNYYYKDNFCILDSRYNFSEPEKRCRDGGRPINNLNGYGCISHRFAHLDSDLCSSTPKNLDETSGFADFCISDGK
ncbi:Vacuolar protein sorting/targeting protein 10 [Thelohanellus kitauei]|uniref:Vacuolar protein sorting/targeting protein 10 n=1 Tax=Thelohanellus kitauei TaxID=669202 RepID=A0A0C2IS46_THEKT|nr:Vacuolar protein sorting/targeting protein 10 [Thelohanellus kitauei]